MDVPAQSWESIAAFYRSIPWAAPMADLVERIAASSFAAHLYAYTSMHTLVVGQTPEIDSEANFLRVDPVFATGRIVRIRFEYVERVFEDRRWTRACAPEDAFAAFERFLHLQRWFVTLPPPA